jgi:RNA polymerase sigma-70 factor (ECF subfamily)
MPLDAVQLAELIDRHAGALRVWIRSRCAADEDVVQEAFCRLAVEEPPPRNPVAWLYRVCRNLAETQRLADERRRRREHVRSRPEAFAWNHADPVEIEETLAAVEALDDELREVLVARIWGGLPFEQIAEMCNTSTATVWRRYQAALEELRSRLEVCCEDRT